MESISGLIWILKSFLRGLKVAENYTNEGNFYSNWSNTTKQF
ncbi:hypothetical protein WwAna1044 [Wolbachia endosymbiont of Drosophila ananassae]|nr:hypothetical protein WwAna1044 [Wolbachia endosymbiont of Drosophila ananassae]